MSKRMLWIFRSTVAVATLAAAFETRVAAGDRHTPPTCCRSEVPVSATVSAPLILMEDVMIEIRQDRVYEFSALWVKEGRQERLQDYFGQAFSIARRYVVRPVLTFVHQSSYKGDFDPTLCFLNEWPSLEVSRCFIENPEEQQLLPQRNEALSRPIATQVRVEQPVSITPEEGDLVEFSALSIRPGKQHQLNANFGQAFSITEIYGVRRLALFAPIQGYHGDFRPRVMALDRWPNAEAFQLFLGDVRLNPLLPLRDDVLSRLVLSHSPVPLDCDRP